VRQVEAILLAADGASVGVGMGQVNRVDSCRLAVSRAGDPCGWFGSCLRRLLPVPGGLEVLLIEAGVKAVVQPGGSIPNDRQSRQPLGPASPCTSPGPVTSSTRSLFAGGAAQLLDLGHHVGTWVRLFRVRGPHVLSGPPTAAPDPGLRRAPGRGFGFRGSGVGSEILRQAEEAARRRECRAGVLYTLSFQAPGFLSVTWLADLR